MKTDLCYLSATEVPVNTYVVRTPTDFAGLRRWRAVSL
jgi:hypothetical protein